MHSIARLLISVPLQPTACIDPQQLPARGLQNRRMGATQLTARLRAKLAQQHTTTGTLGSWTIMSGREAEEATGGIVKSSSAIGRRQLQIVSEARSEQVREGRGRARARRLLEESRPVLNEAAVQT